jgi:hypothetical protein
MGYPDHIVQAAAGETVTFFADHYDSRPQGLPSDRWICDSDYSFQHAANPIKGERLLCLGATYGGKRLFPPATAVREITFKVKSGTKTLSLLFDVGNTPYDLGKLMQDCGDGRTRELCMMEAGHPVAAIGIKGKPRRSPKRT